MPVEVEIAGRITHIRKLGGITFLTVVNGSAQFAVVCDRWRMALEEFAKLAVLRRFDYCHLSVAQRGDDLCALRLMEHHRFGGQWKLAEEQLDVARAYACMLHGIRSYFADKRYLEVRLPTIHFGDRKGEQFRFEFFGLPARLTSSNALFADVYAMQMGPVYSIQKCFRAEKSHTRKHLAEFDMLEAAIPDAEIDEGMRVIEDLVRAVVCGIDSSEFAGLLRIDRGSFGGPFKRERYDVVAERLGITGRGLGQWEESVAGDAPLFVVGFPRGLASWTAESIDNQYTASFNLLLPNVGEVAEGSQRAHDVKQLQVKFHALGLNKQLGWYADAIAYPECRSAGFGMGLERLAMWLFGLKNIRQVHPIYRDTRFSEIPALHARKTP